MSETRLNRASAGLGGMAIALLLVGLVVQQARAGTPCEDCQASADQTALAFCQANGWPVDSGICRGHRQGTRHKLCYQDKWGSTDRPACPDDLPPLKVCGSPECTEFDFNATCPEPYKSRDGGKTCGTICSPCGSYSNPGKCEQVTVLKAGEDDEVTASHCFSTCGCQ